MSRHRIASALSRFQLAESAAMRRARGALGISDSDLNALRHLLAAEEQDDPVTARDLAATVGISPAGATFLIDRLEREGYVRRERSLHDRRSLHVVSTIPPGSEVRAILGQIESPIDVIAANLSDRDAAVVAKFVEELTVAMEGVDPSAADDVHGPRRHRTD